MSLYLENNATSINLGDWKGWKPKILITGGTGSLGSQLARFYSQNGYRVTVLSRNPHRQAALRRELPNVDFVLGDICNYDTVAKAMDGIGIVIHAAALKQVDIGEEQVSEFIRVNIKGAENVARACTQHAARALFISSDKAVMPINLYGKTKAVGEDIFCSEGHSALRYGNVVNSHGAFVEVWRDCIKSGTPITVRTPDPTRFYLTIADAVRLVDAVVSNLGRGVFIPNHLRSFSISQVVAVLVDAMSGDSYFKNTDLIAGEKQHEWLLSNDEQGKVVNDLICSVHKGYNGDLDRNQFCSKTADAMTSQEVRDIFLPLIMPDEYE